MRVQAIEAISLRLDKSHTGQACRGVGASDHDHMDLAARQKLVKVAPETVLLRQPSGLEPGLAGEKPLMMAQLVVVELIEEDERRAAELGGGLFEDSTAGSRGRHCLEPHQLPGSLVE